jgi:hypothetical protein
MGGGPRRGGAERAAPRGGVGRGGTERSGAGRDEARRGEAGRGGAGVSERHQLRLAALLRCERAPEPPGARCLQSAAAARS